jgi:hypothetical protein
MFPKMTIFYNSRFTKNRVMMKLNQEIKKIMMILLQRNHKFMDNVVKSKTPLIKFKTPH